MKSRTAEIVIGGVVVGSYREIDTPAGTVRMGTGVVRVAMERALAEHTRNVAALDTVGEPVH